MPFTGSHYAKNEGKWAKIVVALYGENWRRVNDPQHAFVKQWPEVASSRHDLFAEQSEREIQRTLCARMQPSQCTKQLRVHFQLVIERIATTIPAARTCHRLLAHVAG